MLELRAQLDCFAGVEPESVSAELAVPTAVEVFLGVFALPASEDVVVLAAEVLPEGGDDLVLAG